MIGIICLASWFVVKSRWHTVGTYTAVVLDLRNRLVLRGVPEAGVQAQQPLMLLRGIDNVSLYLPTGSRTGSYDVAVFQEPGTPLVSTAGTASAEDGLTVLRAKLDLSKLKSGHYLLAIRPPRVEWSGVELLPVGCMIARVRRLAMTFRKREGTRSVGPGFAAIFVAALLGVRVPAAKAVVSAYYVGSKVCATCHQEIYARWKQTPMANVVRDPRTHPSAILANFSNAPSFVIFTKADIALVYGSIWKQRYFKKVGNNYYVLPAQWDIKNHQWLPFFVKNGEDWWAPLYPPNNMKRPTGPLCDGCHSVNYNIATHTVTEWNVGCERCHGPGSEHVKNPAQYATNIINPARLDYVDANDGCIQCHVQGRPLQNPINGQYYDWPAGFHVGLHLQDYWKLESHKLGATDFYYFADGTAHKNRMQGNDYVQSLMYRHGVTCFSCHDVHGTDNYAELIKPVTSNQMCLECHAHGSPNGPYDATIEEHTHHALSSAGSRCVSCHMPKIEKEGVPGAFVHAHTFRFITPAMTEKYGIPNPCISCHKDKSNQWATQWLARWFSPWRME